MRPTNSSVEIKDVNWSSLKDLIPYLFEFKGRIGLALLCLIAAKIASVGLPFILKNIVDALDNNTTNGSIDAQQLLILPLALLVAYGLVRFSNVLFGELRDTLFGRVQ